MGGTPGGFVTPGSPPSVILSAAKNLFSIPVILSAAKNDRLWNWVVKKPPCARTRAVALVILTDRDSHHSCRGANKDLIASKRRRVKAWSLPYRDAGSH